MNLSDTKLNKNYIVTDVSAENALLRRFLDIGIIKGTEIKRMFTSPFGDPTAYLIKNSVIALRRSDSDKIYVAETGGGEKNGLDA